MSRKVSVDTDTHTKDKSITSVIKGGSGYVANLPDTRRRRSSYFTNKNMNVFRRLSIQNIKPEIKNVQYSNTYQLSPFEYEKIDIVRINNILSDTVKDVLQNKTYDPTSVAYLVKNLTDLIKNRVRDVNGSGNKTRYKIVVTTLISQNKEMNFLESSRCLWNVDFDSYSTFSFKNDSIVSTCSIYWVYTE
ncbi:Tctex1 domain-containing protein 1 [Intoshia linei]|uniref:Tctex1 domain-containing protein 1 n=1 Tax=Intoshia linei TaxID=1819745 RepID=A0A177AWZ7_9BILA|nr:Tctex1 domain-containing protein 1 [Intoshia linei]